MNYSIIIPHRNIPNLLMRCLRSIPVREDVQVIVVDDNSDDAETYLERYPELSRPYLEFIRTTEGKGAGYARNVGLGHAKGKWLIFADADDFFSEDFVQILEQYEKNTEDILYFRSLCVRSDDISQLADNIGWLDRIFQDYFLSGDDTDMRCLNHNPWAKMFSREFISKNRFWFSETPFSNDLFFVVNAASTANQIKVVDAFIYYYTVRSNSLTSYFGEKPGELGVRLNEAIKTMSVFWGKGYRPCTLPVIQLLSKALHNDKKLFRTYFKKSCAAGPGIWETMRQLRYREHSYRGKIAVYLYSILSMIS